MSKTKSLILWVLAFIFTVSAAIYQRATGPTYPERGQVSINGQDVKYKLIRTHGGDSDAPIEIEMPEGVNGTLSFRTFRTKDAFEDLPMNYTDGKLVAYLPHQPPAGKLEYLIVVNDGENEYKLNEAPTVIRFKGGVPMGILIPHIIFMFTAMFVSTRTGIEVIANGANTLKYATITVVSLMIGGMILGPIVQKYAFGDFWTGWPFGGDWTDNKTIVAFLFWVIAFFVLRRKPKNRVWPLVAMLVLFAVYMIPHSMGGSELDADGNVTTGLKE